MSLPIVENQTATALRGRIRELRHEVETITAEYRAAKRAHHTDAVVRLLRRKSELVRQLFEKQSELLVALRAEVENMSEQPF